MEHEKYRDETGKRSALVPLNLARGLVSLLADRACEFCTPGHRAGKGFQLLREDPSSGAEAEAPQA